MNFEGVWGIAGRSPHPIHYCIDKHTICHPLSQKGRLLRFPLNNWNPDHPETCPVCKVRYDALLAESETRETAEPLKIKKTSSFL